MHDIPKYKVPMVPFDQFDRITNEFLAEIV